MVAKIASTRESAGDITGTSGGNTVSHNVARSPTVRNMMAPIRTSPTSWSHHRLITLQIASTHQPDYFRGE